MKGKEAEVWYLQGQLKERDRQISLFEHERDKASRDLKKKEVEYYRLNTKADYYHRALKNQIGQIEDQKKEIIELKVEVKELREKKEERHKCTQDRCYELDVVTY